jgi:membrane protein implicated in regulation of membrane protease activity
MTSPPRARPPAVAAARRQWLAALVLVALLAVFPALALLPLDAASVRVAGVSLLWWYGGVVAPVLGAALATAFHRRPAAAEQPQKVARPTGA